MKYRTKLHFIHVAGTRMIAQGSDGLSRGNLSEGVMRGAVMDLFIPLNETAFERSATLKDWLKFWVSGDLEFLEPKDWFVQGHDIVEGNLRPTWMASGGPCIAEGLLFGHLLQQLLK